LLIDVFINILRIWWPKTISNKDLWETSQQIPISSEIKMTKWKWIGHTLRRDQNNITRHRLGIQRENERTVDQELPGREQS
jgi:hypothetical protein